MVSTGPISIGGSATSGGLNQSINIELGRAATATSSLNESALRTLAGVPSGAISLSNFYGKSNAFAFTISSPQTDANLRTLAVSAGWNQAALVQATIDPGVQITASSTGTPALTVNGAWPNGVTLTNNGLITGRGGNGGAGRPTGAVASAGNGGGGGTGLAVSSPISITNNSTVAGGGGGGGGGSVGVFGRTFNCSGSGGGGGIGISSGAPAGTSGQQVGFPGGGGTATAAGAGGPSRLAPPGRGGAGGNGGGYGSGGATGGTGINNNGTPGTGGAAGPCTSGNVNITWLVTGNRFGPLN
jgi:hypothetical protein